jgi:hypothetical protein
MASDDDMIDEEDLDAEGFIEEDDPDVDIDEIDEDDLEGEIDEIDEDDAVEVDEDEEETASVARPKRSAEDEDEELLAADDVEEDLAKILDERLRERSEEGEEEEEEEEPPSVADPETSIQPKRPDERMCPQCFLLVRKGAPVCPVGDDTCPLFS